MNLEQQVCSLDLAKRLKELGVKQESHFHWASHSTVNQVMVTDKMPFDHYVLAAAFTVTELGSILLENKAALPKSDFPPELMAELNETDTFIRAMTNADFWAKILIYLLENKLWTPK